MPHYIGPDPDFETDNYPGDFTEITDVEFPSNAHGGTSAKSVDATGNLTRAGIITAADGQEHTLAAWGQSDDLTSEVASKSPVFMAMRQGPGQTRFHWIMMTGAAAHGRHEIRFHRWSNLNELFFVSTNRFDDDIRRQYMVVCESALQSAPETLQDAIRLYEGKNGTRVAGTVIKVGLGDQGGEGLGNLTVLSTENSGVISNSGFITSRPRIWRTTKLTDAQIADYSLDEVEATAAMIEEKQHRGLILLDGAPRC